MNSTAPREGDWNLDTPSQSSKKTIEKVLQDKSFWSELFNGIRAKHTTDSATVVLAMSTGGVN